MVFSLSCLSFSFSHHVHFVSVHVVYQASSTRRAQKERMICSRCLDVFSTKEKNPFLKSCTSRCIQFFDGTFQLKIKIIFCEQESFITNEFTDLLFSILFCCLCVLIFWFSSSFSYNHRFCWVCTHCTTAILVSFAPSFPPPLKWTIYYWLVL